jgi:hypothetical protein
MKKAVVKKAVVLLPMAAGLAVGVVTWAEPPSGVSALVLARGVYDPFKVKAEDPALGFQARSRDPVEIFVRQHDYQVGSTTGWHSHPGPVFITVTRGTLTFYEYDDPTCTPHVVSEGQGYVDSGHGHVGRNESGAPAQDFSVILVPPGAALRTHLEAPNPYCGF